MFKADAWATMFAAFGGEGFVQYYLVHFLPIAFIPGVLIGILTKHWVRAVVYSLTLTAVFSVFLLLTDIALSVAPCTPSELFPCISPPLNFNFLIGVENSIFSIVVDTIVWAMIAWVISSLVRNGRKRKVSLAG
jgi:branched-subunit amino acid ABC-type transport system permease component